MNEKFDNKFYDREVFEETLCWIQEIPGKNKKK